MLQQDGRLRAQRVVVAALREAGDGGQHPRQGEALQRARVASHHRVGQLQRLQDHLRAGRGGRLSARDSEGRGVTQRVLWGGGAGSARTQVTERSEGYERVPLNSYSHQWNGR